MTSDFSIRLLDDEATREKNGTTVWLLERDGLQLLGEALELCGERGLEVRSIVHADPPAPVSARVAARQRAAAQRAYQAWV